jgi:hypothetical protein
MTRFEHTTSCLIDKHVTSLANAFTGKHGAVGGRYNNRWCSVNFFAHKIKIRGENDGIFGWGFVIWIPHSQSMFYTLMVYSSTKGLAVVGVFILFQDFPSCFGVNDGVEHAACSIANECLCRGYTQVQTEHQYLSQRPR